MQYAVELRFDAGPAGRVRELWRALVAAGLPAASFLTKEYEPHISVAVFETSDVEAILPALRRAIGPAAGLRLSLSALGFFLDGGPARAYLGVPMTDGLVHAHRSVAAAFADTAATPRPYYLANAWTPHCTLPVEVTDAGTIVAVVRRFGLPVVAATASVDLIELPSGSSVGSLL